MFHFLSLLILFRQHKDRLAIPTKQLKEDFKKWVQKKLTKPAEAKFMLQIRQKHRSIYNIIVLAKARFPKSIPDGLLDLFRCLYSDSPVCSYVPPHNNIEILMFDLLKPGILSIIGKLETIQQEIPLFFYVLKCFMLEGCLPEEFKGLIIDLLDKSRKPFVNARMLHTPLGEGDTKNSLAWYLFFYFLFYREF